MTHRAASLSRNTLRRAWRAVGFIEAIFNVQRMRLNRCHLHGAPRLFAHCAAGAMLQRNTFA